MNWFRSSGARAFLALIFVYAIGAVFSAQGVFFDWGTQRDLLRQIAVPGILACGMTIVILTGGIDLSVGSVLGASSVLFSLLTLHHSWSPLSAILVTLGLGATFGLVSGGLIARLGIQAFVATLAHDANPSGRDASDGLRAK